MTGERLRLRSLQIWVERMIGGEILLLRERSKLTMESYWPRLVVKLAGDGGEHWIALRKPGGELDLAGSEGDDGGGVGAAGVVVTALLKWKMSSGLIGIQMSYTNAIQSKMSTSGLVAVIISLNMFDIGKADTEANDIAGLNYG
ncbi:hypothetical protein HHK36_021747 [Tetracentron sinense]|uniref:Uncharacterized protein n=1 Tax=Tetracentron sinense TaxID=13715 RepID=A0A834YVN5_TETSI|nr:hypothetical protein HHK36_021747 [Tetracentron sinense]